jgi:hypothetical protein
MDLAKSSEFLSGCLKIFFPPNTSAISAIDTMATWLHYQAIWPTMQGAAKPIEGLTSWAACRSEGGRF